MGKNNTKCPNCGSDYIYEAGPKSMMCETCGEMWKKEKEFQNSIIVSEEDFKESFLEEEEDFKEPIEESPFYDEENPFLVD